MLSSKKLREKEHFFKYIRTTEYVDPQNQKPFKREQIFLSIVDANMYLKKLH